ncbi:uncharacterized protein [Nicotiana sylvestris]|uniref:uncharacterized protein n=1 Tax=Nicotiana sylvestris TaxID=4096 RepID=UPI00388C4708
MTLDSELRPRSLTLRSTFAGHHNDEKIGHPRFYRKQRPLGIVDDVLVRVDMFILPADFVILDCEVDYEVPIILDRPFLVTGKTLVDVEAGELTFRVSDEKVVFHVCKSMRKPNINEVCSSVDLLTYVIIDDASGTMNIEDTLEAIFLNLDDDEEKDGYVECSTILSHYPTVSNPEIPRFPAVITVITAFNLSSESDTKQILKYVQA